MKVFIIILTYFLYIHSVVSSDDLTIYVWQPDTERAYRGQCYEIDKETGGQKFVVKTNRANCRLETVRYIWLQNEGKAGGRCYEVDSETSGQKYSATASKEKCRPKNIKYSWEVNQKGKGFCFEMDVETGGSTYLKKTKSSNCKTKKNIKKWVADRLNPYRGKCLSLDAETMGALYQETLSSRECRPSETKYEWIQKDQFTSGTCYEVDKYEGPQYYSIQVSSKKCMGSKPKTSYQWVRDEKKIYGGKCYEIVMLPSGESMSNSVNSKKCRPEKIKNIFMKLSKGRGKCVEVDVLTEGSEYSQGIHIDNCRLAPHLLNTSWFPKTPGMPEGCYEFDRETQGSLFIEKLDDLKCQTSSSYEWIADKSGWGGRCKSMIKVGGKLVSKGVVPSFCKPKEVKLAFHNRKKLEGYCYIIDAKNGNEFFSLVVERKKCRPKEVVHIFYKAKGEPSGRCYRVDKETKGELFNRKVGKKYCKENLFQERLKKSVEDYAPIDQGDLP